MRNPKKIQKIYNPKSFFNQAKILHSPPNKGKSFLVKEIHQNFDRME